MPNKLCLIDFEYRKPADKDMGLVCCCLQVDGDPVERFWLADHSDEKRLVSRLVELAEHTFVGYAIQMAECRCFYALGLDPRKFKWRDLYSEYKWLANSDDRWQYGKFTLTGAKTECVYRFKPSMRKQKRMTSEEEDAVKRIQKEEAEIQTKERGIRATVDKCDQTLLSVEYHYGLLTEADVEADSKVKAETRRIILSGFRLDVHKTAILDYCASDIHLLGKLSDAILADMTKVANEPHLMVVKGAIHEIRPSELMSVEEIAESMGHWCAQNATYAMRGIPLHPQKLEAVIKSSPELKKELQMGWNLDHPEFPLYRIGSSKKELESFKKLRTKSPYKDVEITLDDDLFASMARQIEKIGEFKWKRTKAGKYAADSDYLKELSGKGESDPIYCLRKHKDAVTALKAMIPDKEGVIKAMTFIGSDYRQRPNYNPYGTKTGRNAPSATSFLFLQPKQFRVMVNPPEGRYICDLDAHSEEVAIAAAVYDDDNKREVYRSADVYMRYAQLAGAYPSDKPILTEDQRSSEKWFVEEGWDIVRQAYKGGVLGMQFGMGGKTLRQRVLLSLPKSQRCKIDAEWGERFVEEYHNTFNKEFTAVSLLKKLYTDCRMGVILADGWRIGPDEDNILTIGNFPVQGTGAAILRRCCQLCDEAGIQIYATLHDAISITGKSSNKEEDIKKARECFRQAAVDVLGEDLMAVGNPEIVEHGDVWLHSSKARDSWNQMAERHFPEFLIKKEEK